MYSNIVTEIHRYDEPDAFAFHERVQLVERLTIWMQARG